MDNFFFIVINVFFLFKMGMSFMFFLVFSMSEVFSFLLLSFLVFMGGIKYFLGIWKNLLILLFMRLICFFLGRFFLELIFIYCILFKMMELFLVGVISIVWYDFWLDDFFFMVD